MSVPFPILRTAGYDGLLVSFADALSEPANRAALAFRAAVEASGLEAVKECSTSLVSAYVRFDPLETSHADMQAALEKLLEEQSWYDAPLPTNRRLWRVPTVYGGAHGPQLAEAAEAAGISEEDGIASLSSTKVRVQTIGFAPGMPYLGELDAAWDIPRLTQLTDEVPRGGLCVAIRQLVLFPVATPTGWRHIGQTALELFRPDEAEPFFLRAGDEVIFEPATAAELEALAAKPNGGATSEALS